MLAIFSGKMEGGNQVNRFSVSQEGLGSMFKVPKGFGLDFGRFGPRVSSFPKKVFGLDF